MAAPEEAHTELLDIARGLEDLPVSVWPPGAEPPPFQYSPDPVAGPGADADPAEVTLPGCACRAAPCAAGACPCLRGAGPYDARGALVGLRAGALARPVFECGALCACGEACAARVVQRGPRRRLQVFRAGAKGWGLRALDAVPEGQFVCEYAGEVLGAAEARRRLRARAPGRPHYLLAVREHVRGGRVLETFVDPARVGNAGRFLNHACEPNLLMVPVRVHSVVPRLALFAARDIPPREELTFDYSGRFLNPLGGGAPGRAGPATARTPCLCGARTCAGLLPYDGGDDDDDDGALGGPAEPEPEPQPEPRR